MERSNMGQVGYESARNPILPPRHLGSAAIVLSVAAAVSKWIA
jgi:hypothetical protein